MPGAARQETGEAQRVRDNLLSKAYSRASKDLREKYPDEFAAFMEKHTADLGVDWQRKQTPEQKAESEFRRLLEQNPWLMEKFTQPREEPGSVE